MKLRAGLRRGELLGLRREHTHLDQGFLTVAESHVRVGGGIKVEAPKGTDRAASTSRTRRSRSSEPTRHDRDKGARQRARDGKMATTSSP